MSETTMIRNGILCRLNEAGLEAQRDYEDFKSHYGGCYCHITIPPCGSCTHEGHPLAIDETEAFWEPVPTPKRKGVNLFSFLDRFKSYE